MDLDLYLVLMEPYVDLIINIGILYAFHPPVPLLDNLATISQLSPSRSDAARRLTRRWS